MLFEVDHNGVCRSPDFHDGFLTGIISNNQESVRIFLQHIDGSEWEVVIPQVERMRASNFEIGNIVFELRMLTGTLCLPESLSRLYGLHNKNPFLIELTNTIRTNQWLLLHVQCSTECEVLVLSKSTSNEIVVRRTTS